ncbi:hypothetical protein V1J52_16575 [Streptomyces sp. TRM 70351]|uniref:hypothetical protein n=1 Tax=Streptomyces sp. TRM 70351 TaxID=3116552 RepID=UPI002E7B9691|nr:hypothetical protein [Streptomyces sp. TRM 70351]MEE1929783.1 hypothetical protein [Streptomyces sp. TRM 70351]
MLATTRSSSHLLLLAVAPPARGPQKPPVLARGLGHSARVRKAEGRATRNDAAVPSVAPKTPASPGTATGPAKATAPPATVAATEPVGGKAEQRPTA